MNSNDNVVSRLKQRLKDARSLGFNVRMELLDGEHGTWCEIAGVPTLFVDLAQTAAEQLHQVEETLAIYLDDQAAANAGGPKTAASRREDDELAKRAA